MDKVEKKRNPFDHFKRISKSHNKSDDLSDYNPFLCETYFSHYKDTVLLSEAASTLRVPNHIHELFMRGVITKGSRKHFWPKKPKNEKLDNIMSHYQVSREKALEILELMPKNVYKKLFVDKRTKDYKIERR